MTTTKDRLRDRRVHVALTHDNPKSSSSWNVATSLEQDPLCVEAADEIERLEGDVKLLTIRRGNDLISITDVQEKLLHEIALLKSDLAKAREDALEEAAKVAELHFIPFHSVAGPRFAAACAEAIRALKEKP